MVDPNRNINLNFSSHFKPSSSNHHQATVKIHLDEDDENDDDGEEVYCICRTSDTNRFMIGCDHCNEWYHGDCISITEEYAKKIKKFFCLICRDKDSSLEIQYKERKSVAKKEKAPPKVAEPVVELKVPIKVETEGPLEFKRNAFLESDEEEEEDMDEDDEDDFVPQSVARNSSRKKADEWRKGKKGKRKADIKQAEKASKRSKASEAKSRKSHRKSQKELPEVDEGPKQCYGQGCTNAARKGSKYCSDECGLKLATNRIYEILPHRIRQWQSTASVADEFSKKELESIRHQQLDAKRILDELDLKQKMLEELIKESQTIKIISEDEANEDADPDNELSIYCVTCGHEVSYKNAVRHMERCFNKYESQTSYGSAYKTKIEGVFCDAFNPHQKTYCKRLRVLCPEHCKDPKISDDEVCGCPLVQNVFNYNGGFCRLPKKKCIKHFGWAKLRRAEIDMERLQQWFKLEELFEKEQKIRFTMANRGGVLALMLHQTITHD